MPPGVEACLTAAAVCCLPQYGSYVNGQWQNDEYGDRSGAMALMQFTCFNAPNAWRLGWLLPFATLNGASLNIGSPVRFDVPVQLSSDRSFVLINLDWITPTTNFFISYRSAHPPHGARAWACMQVLRNSLASAATALSALQRAVCPLARGHL